MTIIKRIIRLVRGEWRYINYNKRYPQTQCWKHTWKPSFDRHWRGDIWQVGWRGWAISVDMRTNWIADMVDPDRPDR